jgi:hypothetical protein
VCSTDKNCDFSDLQIGDIFLHAGTTYRKLDDNSATVLDAAASETIHLFYPEDPVALADDDSLNGD